MHHCLVEGIQAAEIAGSSPLLLGGGGGGGGGGDGFVSELESWLPELHMADL